MSEAKASTSFFEKKEAKKLLIPLVRTGETTGNQIKKVFLPRTSWVSDVSSRRFRRTLGLWLDGLPRRFAPRNDVVGLIVSETQANGVKKLLIPLVRTGETSGNQIKKVFCFFFSKKKRFLCLASFHSIVLGWLARNIVFSGDSYSSAAMPDAFAR